MAALISDLDGTIFDWGTEKFLPGAHEELARFCSVDGNQLIFVTQRSSQNWSEPLSRTELYLKRFFPGCVVIFGISSPRILVNDAGAVAINHPKNSAWNYDLLSIASMAETP